MMIMMICIYIYMIKIILKVDRSSSVNKKRNITTESVVRV